MSASPAGAPPQVVERLGRAIAQAIGAPDVQRDFQALGVVGQASSSQQMTERMQADISRWRAAIDRAGIPRQ